MDVHTTHASGLAPSTLVRPALSVAGGVALLALLGHASGLEVLTSWRTVPDAVLSVGTAVALLLVVAAAVTGPARRGLATTVAVLALAVLVGRWTAAPLPVPEALPADTTALALLGLGLGLAGWPRRLALVGTLLATAVVTTTAIGRGFDAAALYGADEGLVRVGTSLPTLVALVALVVAVVGTHPTLGPWRVLFEDRPGRVLALWLTAAAWSPVAVGLVVHELARALGWSQQAEQAVLLGVLVAALLLLAQLAASRTARSWAREREHTAVVERARDVETERAVQRGRLLRGAAVAAGAMDRDERTALLVELAVSVGRVEAAWLHRPGEEPVLLGVPPDGAVAAVGALPAPRSGEDPRRLADGVVAWPVTVGEEAVGWLGAALPRDDAAGTADEESLALLATIAGGLCSHADQLARQAAEQESRDALLFGLSHELRTPLTTLIGGVSGLQELPDLDEASRAQVVEAVGRAAARLSGHLDAILRVEGLRQGRVAAEPEPVVLVPAITAAAAAAGVELRLELPEELRVMVDPGHLTEVLDVLLDNVARYAGGAATVTGGAVEDVVRVAVVDHGDGVPVAVRNDLAAPFARGTKVVGHAPGLGLGLTVATGLVAVNGGTLQLGGTEGGGMTATIELPRA